MYATVHKEGTIKCGHSLFLVNSTKPTNNPKIVNSHLPQRRQRYISNKQSSKGEAIINPSPADGIGEIPSKVSLFVCPRGPSLRLGLPPRLGRRKVLRR